MPIIAPSLLAADFLQLGKECEMINKSEAEWFHLDVMDGRFVPNISFGVPVIEQIRKATKKVCDVHLMVVEPERWVETFHKAGADNLSIHLEASIHLHRTIEHIKSLGMKAGVAINPHTPVNGLVDIIQYIDIVLMMTVNPGFGGQKFIPHSLEKIKQVRRMSNERGLSVLIEIDGGVTLENAASIVEAGADVLIAGNTIFKSPDPIKMISELKAITNPV